VGASHGPRERRRVGDAMTGERRCGSGRPRRQDRPLISRSRSLGFLACSSSSPTAQGRSHWCRGAGLGHRSLFWGWHEEVASGSVQPPPPLRHLPRIRLLHATTSETFDHSATPATHALQLDEKRPTLFPDPRPLQAPGWMWLNRGLRFALDERETLLRLAKEAVHYVAAVKPNSHDRSRLVARVSMSCIRPRNIQGGDRSSRTADEAMMSRVSVHVSSRHGP
jgi:hypothetical protein